MQDKFDELLKRLDSCGSDEDPQTYDPVKTIAELQSVLKDLIPLTDLLSEFIEPEEMKDMKKAFDEVDQSLTAMHVEVENLKKLQGE